MENEENKIIFEVKLNKNGDCSIEGNAEGSEVCAVIASIVDALANTMSGDEDDYMSNVGAITEKVKEYLIYKSAIEKLGIEE